MPVKPTEEEDEYFARLEFARQRKAFGERVAKDEPRPTRSAGRDDARNATRSLSPSPIGASSLDKCSRCQGRSLDFGELDQVVTEDTGLFRSIRRIFS